VTKRVVGAWVLLLVGSFLVTIALLLWFWAPSRVERTPLDVNTYTYLSGQAKKLNPTTGKVEDVPVSVLSRTQVDPSKSDDKVIVFVQYACVNIDKGQPPGCLTGSDPRLITNDIDTFAADRNTGMAVNDSKYVSPDAGKHEGLVNKFPFNTEQKDYPYWDGLLGRSVTAAYQRTTSIDGLKVYVFQIDVPPENAEIATGIQGTYQTQTTFYVEPRTGAIVNEIQSQKRLLPDGSTVLDMQLQFTNDTVSTSVSDGKHNIRKLDLVDMWAPLAAMIVGVIVLGIGLVLLLGGRRGEHRYDPERSEERQPV